MYFFLIFLQLFFVSFSSAEQDLEHLNGFLYKTDKDVWILSPSPHLKSCCIGNFEKNLDQIIIEGNFSDALINKEVHLEGQLILESNKKKLIHAEIVHEKERHFPWTTLISMGVVLLLLYTFVKVWH